MPLHASRSGSTKAEEDAEEKGVFTFGVTLMSTGDIIFAYRTIPMSIQAMRETSNVVKVGLSDAYYINDKREYYLVILPIMTISMTSINSNNSINLLHHFEQIHQERKQCTNTIESTYPTTQSRMRR